MKISNRRGRRNGTQIKKNDETSTSRKRKKSFDNITDHSNTSEEDDINEFIVRDNLDKKNGDDINDDSDDFKENVSEEIKIKNLQKVIKSRENKLKRKKNNSLEVSKKKACDLIELLQESKRKPDILKKSCKFEPKPLSNGKEYGWDSFKHITKHMQHCILNQEWHNFPDLILLLLRHPGKGMKLFKNFIKEMSYLNFLVNAGTDNADLLDQFYQQMFVTIPRKKMKNLEVWYREDS